MSAVPILVVDDDGNAAQLIRDVLKPQRGFQTSWSATGRSALEELEKRPPGLILLDLMLPDTDGFEVLRTIKSRPETRGIPVVLMTTLTERSVEERALRSGADAFLLKPFSPKALLELARRLCGAS